MKAHVITTKKIDISLEDDELRILDDIVGHGGSVYEGLLRAYPNVFKDRREEIIDFCGKLYDLIQ